mgnify:FL=1
MPLVGEVDLRIRLGGTSFPVVVYVFRELGADVLLGVNALDAGR